MRSLEEAIKIIREGGIVIFPTDTAFGIGCRIDDEEAVRKLFEIRKRPKEMATPVLFDSIKRVKELVLPFDSKVDQLMNKYWPGGLTLILRSLEEKIPELVRGGGNTLGVRVPDHEFTLELIKRADVPILGPSANFHGGKTPYTFEELDKTLLKLVDFVVGGKTSGKRLPSTIVDCTVLPFKIVRQGEVLPEL